MKTPPDKYLSRMKALLGADFELYMDSMKGPPAKGLHFNSAYVGAPEFLDLIDFKADPIPYCPNGMIHNVEKPGNRPHHHAGLFYVQEPSAMAAVSAIEVRDCWTALDLCAAPGGKTSQLALLLANGAVVANEAIRERCGALTGNIERMGHRNVITTQCDAEAICASCAGDFDLTLVDAPCSGEGLFRKDAGAVNEWSEERVAGCAARQLRILNYAAASVRTGGFLIYSTCTFSVEENEMNVISFLCRNPEFKLIPCRDAVVRATGPGIDVKNGAGADLSMCRRFYPFGAYAGEGQFIAAFQKTDDAYRGLRPDGSGNVSASYRGYRRNGGLQRSGLRNGALQRGGLRNGALQRGGELRKDCGPRMGGELRKDGGPRMGGDLRKDGGPRMGGDLRRYAELTRAERAPIDRFLDENVCLLEKPEILLIDDKIYCSYAGYAPNVPMRANGVALGVVRGGRVIPAHHFFSAFGNVFIRKIQLRKNDRAVFSYLKGDALALPADGDNVNQADDGWAAVIFDGIPLGGAKIVTGTAKNHYPKGLRLRS